MDEDTIVILAVVLLGGVAVWWFLSRDSSTVAKKPPCNIAGSFQGTGISIPCSTVDKVVGAAGEVVGDLFHAVSLPFGGSMGSDAPPATLQQQVDVANAAGNVWMANLSHLGGFMSPTKLPIGYVNAVVNGKIQLVPKSGTPDWKGTPIATNNVVRPTSQTGWNTGAVRS